MSDFLTQLHWREATKSFDPQKPLDDTTLNKIIEAIQFTPSSFGLQPYHIYVITNPETKAAIRPHAWNQAQVTDCSHLLAFCARTDIPQRIQDYQKTASKGDEATKEKLKPYIEMMQQFTDQFKGEALVSWAQKQTYIALGFAMAACAELKIDACPMEGFSAPEVDEILSLPTHQKTTLLLPIGYRAEDSPREKVRFPKEELFTKI